jgi:hypothetical protein
MIILMRIKRQKLVLMKIIEIYYVNVVLIIKYKKIYFHMNIHKLKIQVKVKK